MQGIDSLFYFGILLASGFALLNWQKGIYAALLIDVLRDPIRKLDPSESIGITLSGSVVWGAVVLGSWLKNGKQLPYILRAYPGLRQMNWMIVGALVPGGLLSILLYNSGWLLSLIGAFSYLAPLAGLYVGVFYLRDEAALRRLLMFFVIVNSIALFFTFAEWQGYNWQILGGLKGMVWLRYRTGYTVALISGVYRSPDIMGLHAAYVVMFALYSAVHPKTRFPVGWYGFAVMAGTCLLLCGRRKMIGIPLVFICAWLFFHWLFSRGNRRLAFGVPLAVLTVTSIVAIAVVSATIDLPTDYADYALTTVTEGSDRFQRGTVNSVIATVQNSGVLGDGLGICTQGRYYLGNVGVRAWQEDGLSRLFVELGVPGVLLLVFAALTFLKVMQRSFRISEQTREVHFAQTGLWGMFVACGASYIVAHQHYSGDPGMALFSVMLAGMALGLPLWQHWQNQTTAFPNARGTL